MAMMISWVALVNPFHPSLENDPAPSFDPHHLRIPPWLWFSNNLEAVNDGIGKEGPLSGHKVDGSITN